MLITLAYGARIDRCDINKHWSILEPEHGVRTLSDIVKFARSKKFNCISQPLFVFIPITHVVIDTLNIFLRISDNLTDLLIKELKFHDAIDKKNKFSGGFNRNKYTSMA